MEREKISTSSLWRQPVLDGLGVMDAQIVDDQKNLLFPVLDETLHESMKIVTLNERLAGLITPTGNDHLRTLPGEGEG
jgi:hypothetical protein